MNIHVDFPALDRLVDYLLASEQAKIDDITKQVIHLTDHLKNSSTTLSGVVNS